MSARPRLRVAALCAAYRRGALLVSADPLELLAARRSGELAIDARRVAEALVERDGGLVFDEVADNAHEERGVSAAVQDSRQPAAVDLMAELSDRSRALRCERAAKRRAMRSGELLLSEVVRERPAWALDLTLFELAGRQRFWGADKLVEFNRRAVAAGVNLALPLGRASERMREWLCATLEESGR